jgi:hypothetical protein
VRYYFDQPLAMPLDVTEIAVLEEDPEAGQVAAKLEPFDVLESEVRPLIPGWSRSKTPPAVSSDQHVEDFVRLLADETSLDFVSPIFRDPNGNPMIVTGEILVRFWPEVSKRVAEATLLGSVAGEIVATDWGGMDNAFRMRIDSRNGFDVLQAANTLAQRADVKWAEPNMLATAIPHLIPNDAYFDQQWALRNTGQNDGLEDFDMDADQAWDITTGSEDVVVVIFDDGVQQNHPDINQGPGIDFTGSGTGGGPLNECDNHGTAVAGCVSATINNLFGVTGLAPTCLTRSAKFSVAIVEDPCPGTAMSPTDALVDAMAWAVDIGARVTNTSYTLNESAALSDQYANTHQAGLIHFGSTGNDSRTDGVNYPASLNVVNGVGALDRTGFPSPFSNWGPGITFSAPGNEVWTTDRTGSEGYSSQNYVLSQGTSIASPYAAAVAALILSMAPDLAPGVTAAVMYASSTDLGFTGYDTTYGWGLVNAYEAILEVTCGESSGNCFTANGTPGCNAPQCCAAVCEIDPTCCNTAWDAACAQQANETCGNCGLPGSGNCFFPGGSVTPGCEDLECCQLICSTFFYCCEVEWDPACAAQANELCAPPNDDCIDAVYVVDNTTYNGNFIAATIDGNASCAAPESHPDVWFYFIAPDDGTLTATTCGSHDLPGQDLGPDTILSAHAGCPGTGGNQLACNDDSGAGCPGDLGFQRDSAIEVPVVAGQQVYLRVSYYGNDVADGRFKLNVDFEAIIPNNVCSQAIPISNIGATFCTDGADTDGPTPCGMGSDIWYTYEATFTGTISVPTCASGYDTVVAVYDGCDCTPTLDRLLGCNDNSCGVHAWVTVPVVAGGCYLIQVGGAGGDQGCGIIPNVVPDVVNDGCNSALPAGPGGTPFSTAGTTSDGPQPCGLSPGADAWFEYTATTTGSVTIDTCDATFDSVLAAYEGCACPIDLADLVACSDNDCGPQQSTITFPIVAGQCYKIQIAGGFFQQGSGTLTIVEDGACVGDTDGSGVVDVTDLVNVIIAWGTDDPAADVSGDGIVDVLDLVQVILNWGVCT